MIIEFNTPEFNHLYYKPLSALMFFLCETGTNFFLLATTTTRSKFFSIQIKQKSIKQERKQSEDAEHFFPLET